VYSAVDANICQFGDRVSQGKIVKCHGVGRSLRGENGHDIRDDACIPVVAIYENKNGVSVEDLGRIKSSQIPHEIGGVVLLDCSLDAMLGDIQII
jgi:hypothetical protein